MLAVLALVDAELAELEAEDADVAAAKFVHAIENKRRFVVIPWQMGWVARLMRFIPPVIWDFLAKNAPHKPRINVE